MPGEHEPMFGRGAEQGALTALLEGGARLVTVTGPGGIGKTRLAEEIASSTREIWPGGVLVVRLADARDVSRAVARALGVRLPKAARRSDEEDAMLPALLDALRARKAMLLVLDDADAVLAQAAAFARACMAQVPEARILATTREPLGIAGERVVSVPPLGAGEALQMFEARTGEAPDDDARALVARLEGIPLAIDLAAGRVRVMSPRELLARLEERFRILKSDRRDLPERHTTLAGTLEWSWELSGLDERRAFACLGAFAGAPTLEAFEAVCGPEIQGDPIDAASALLRKSLVKRLDVRGPARLSMLETLRAFARGKLTAMEHREAIEGRHARFYLERAEKTAARTYGPEAEQALDALEADLPDLLAIFERERDRAPEIAARVGVALADLALFRDAVDLRHPCLSGARAAADRTPDHALRARARVLEAKVALELGQPDDAARTLDDARALSDGTPVHAEVLRSLGWARIALGQLDEADASLELAFSLHHANHETRGEADAMAARGIIRTFRGETEGAHAFFSAAHALHVASGDAIRRSKVVEMARFAGLTLEDGARPPSVEALMASAEAHRKAGRAWRAELDLARAAVLAQSTTQPAQPSAPPKEAWSIGPEARWLVTPDGTRTDLMRHGPVRRILHALVALQHEDRKMGRARGRALSALELLEAGWPGERVRYEAGMLRVYTAIRRLRKLGLEPVLLTRDDGYLLDPEAHFSLEN